MFTYDVLIEQPTLLKAGGFRFNAYFWQLYRGETQENCDTILDFYIKGFRIFAGKVHLPAYSNRQPHPNVYLPDAFATALVDALLADKPRLQELFPLAFPWLNRALLIQELQYPQAHILGDFPRLAAARGLLDVS